jgi:negative regulator of sigma-B (phosphoserine phosphatase)
MDALEASDGWPGALERGVAGAALDGEDRSGDLAVFVPVEGGGLACLIDGLGHGDPAADASAAAAEVIREHAEAPAQELLDRCHEALRETRGAVMTLARLTVEDGRMEWTGVGNVDARLWHPSEGGRHEVALVFGGVVGYQVPKVRPATVSLAPGDLLVMVTDGIDPAFPAALEGGGSAQAIAERIFPAYAKGTDDSLAIVIRYSPLRG